MEKIETLLLEAKYQEALTELAKKDQTNANVMIGIGRALAGLGRYSEAADKLRKAAEAYSGMRDVTPQSDHSEQQKIKPQHPQEEVEAVPVVVDESPSLPKAKFDWYQSPTHVFVSIAAKKTQPNELSVTVASKLVDVAVFNKCRLRLIPFALLDPANSTHSLTEYKIELKLAKLVAGNWPQLEATEVAPPAQIAGNTLPKPYSSGKSSKDWNKIEKEVIDPSEEEASGDPLNSLLKKIYKDADEDTRRAMMKSYQTSGGTVLTTNWKEAAEKDFAKEIKPPKGQVYKSWEGEVIAKDDDDE